MTPKAPPETLTFDSLTPDYVRDLISAYGNLQSAARAVYTRFRDRYNKTPSANALRLQMDKVLRGEEKKQPTLIDPVRERVVNQILNIIDEAGIPLEALDHDDPVSAPKLRSGFHEVVTRGVKTTRIVGGKKVVTQGPPIKTRARSKSVTVTLNPIFKGPKWPVVQPAQPVIIKHGVRKTARSSDSKTIVVISDTQIGYLRDPHDLSKLTPMHDEAAIDVAIQIVADIKPRQIGYVGDFLDLNEMSRWLQLPEFFRTTQPAIDEGHKILARFEAAAGPGRDPTQFAAGNHDRRLREYLVKNAMAAYGLRQAKLDSEFEPPDEGNTIPWALRFKELGIEYVGEYPGGEWWITDNLVVRHNPESRNAYGASVIAGHTHKVARTTYSERTRGGPKPWTLYEIGCLCRLDKYADKASLMATSVPSNRGFVKDWAHGFAVVTVTPDGGHAVELVDYVSANRAIFRGKEYTSERKAA